MLIILNHKMNLTIKEIKEYEKVLRDYKLVVMPQTPYMALFTNGNYTLGSQCISEYTATGGVSAEALNALNVKYVLVGHGERREINRDTDEVILDKAKEILKHRMIPILCIGESLNEKDKIKEVLKQQIDSVLENVKSDNIIIAYEPLWNIGTNEKLDTEKISYTIKFIKAYIKDTYNLNLKVLYGGGVNASNIDTLKKINNLEGLLIGTASLNIDNVIKIYKNLREI